MGCGYGLDDVDEAEYGTYDEDAHDLEGATLLQRTVSEGANNKVNSFVKISIRNFNDEFSGFHTNFRFVTSSTFCKDQGSKCLKFLTNMRNDSKDMAQSNI